MMLAADTDIWRYQFHPEVWILVAGAVALGWYAVKVIGAHAVPAGQPAVTRRNVIAYTFAIVALWGASDWPLHDISEEYLYSSHMIQHLIISFVIPPLLLVATPEWLARLIMSPSGSAGVWIRRFSHPVVAGVVFNIVVAVTHLTTIVNTSVDNGIFHYLVHLAVFLASMMMWIPIVGPIQELRLKLPSQMVYLFLMSVIPTVPAAFLTFADGALYESYDHTVRLWGISVQSDQQAAGVVMKLVGGLYLWSWIITRFFQWHRAELGDRPDLVLVPTPGADLDPDLTFEDVQAEFDRTDPASTDA